MPCVLNNRKKKRTKNAKPERFYFVSNIIFIISADDQTDKFKTRFNIFDMKSKCKTLPSFAFESNQVDRQEESAQRWAVI